MSKKPGILLLALAASAVLVLAPALGAAEAGSILTWHTYAGSNLYDEASGVAVDSSGNVYVAGVSEATWGNPKRPHSGGKDVFVAKLSSSGVLQWNTFLGSEGQDRTRNGIAVDGAGNVYVAGVSEATWGSPLHAHPGEHEDSFVAKLSPSGVLQWNLFIGGDREAYINGIAVNGSGSVHVAGWTVNGWSDAFWGTPVSAPDICQEAFAVKLDSSGTPQWYTFMGGDGGDLGTGIAVDGAGNVYVSGWSDATWGTPVNERTADGGFEGFAAKLDGSGNRLWHTFFGGAGQDEPWDVAVDARGDVLVSGHSQASWGTPINPYGGGTWDAFAVKLDGVGNRQWNTFLGGVSDDFGWAIDVDSSGGVHVAGMGCATWGTPILPFAGQCDAYVAQLDPSGFLQWSTFVGSAGFEGAGDVAVDWARNVFLAGGGDQTWGTPVHPHTGGMDAFVARLAWAIVPDRERIAFGPQPVGTTSAPQTLTLTNVGGAPEPIPPFDVTSDFGYTDTCGAILTPGAGCTVSVTFTPTAEGPRSGELLAYDYVDDTWVLVLPLSGIGTAPHLRISPASLTFPPTRVGSASPEQTVTLRNTGTAPLTTLRVAISSDFRQRSNCVTPIPVGYGCTLWVAFTPRDTGTRTGTLGISSNAPDSPHSVALSGIGFVPAPPLLSLSPTSLNFGEVPLFSPKTLLLRITNAGGQTLIIGGASVSHPYFHIPDIARSPCHSLNPGRGCWFPVTFYGPLPGTFRGTLSLSTNAAGPDRVSLTARVRFLFW